MHAIVCVCMFVHVHLSVCMCTECKCGPLDLAFIVDSSESIGASNFALAKDFIITVIDRLMKDQQIKVHPRLLAPTAVSSHRCWRPPM